MIAALALLVLLLVCIAVVVDGHQRRRRRDIDHVDRLIAALRAEGHHVTRLHRGIRMRADVPRRGHNLPTITGTIDV